MPAVTLAGAIGKFKIACLAADDHDLSVWQDLKDPWMANVIRDLERLAGEAQS